MDAEDTGCPLCGGKRFVTRYRLEPGFRTVRCRDCRFVFLHPYPSEAFLADHYRSRTLYGQYSQRREDYDRAVADRAALIRNALMNNNLSSHPGFSFDGRALDFGAGVGIAVAALRDLGFEAAGLEMNPQAQAAARALFDVDISDRDLGDIAPGLRLLTLFEVLEHIRYPRAFLQQVRDTLAEGGAIVGSVPNYNSFARYALGRRSVALAFPEHISQFTASSLRAVLEQAGFRVGYIGSPPPYGVVITLDLRRRLKARFGQNRATEAISNMLTFIKKHLIYPLPNLFVRRTGWLATGLVFMAYKAQTPAIP